ncbi:MAG: serine/threonine protein kinase [Proteobacteria bacterium]|nr:serine/threonine protein kinase [Pseudomonadota bacterium]
MHLPEGRKVDRYIIEDRIGEGAMAVVYSARHETLASQHAIKVLVKATPKVSKRLLAEGRAQGKLRHPNIVAVTDVIVIDGQAGLVMEYVRGPTLAALIADGNLSVNRGSQLAEGIMEGAAYAHAHSLIHRDIKPQNILIALTPSGPQPKILDFGLVKFMSESIGGSMFTQSVTGSLVGTPYYMAPEQFEMGQELNAAADVWSLGVVLFEVLTGERPFQGKDVLAVMMDIRKGKVPSIADRVPDLNAAQVRAIDGALKVQVEERWRDAGEMLAAWKGNITEPGRTRGETHGEDPWTAELRQRFLGEYEPGPTPLDSASETLDPGADWHNKLDTSEVPKALPRTPQTPLAPARESSALAWVGIAALLVTIVAGFWVMQPGPEAPPAPVALPPTATPPELAGPASTVTVEGVEASFVRFKDAHGIYPADALVPAGIYQVLLRDASGKEQVAHDGYAIVAGQTYTLRCKAKAWTCN